MLKQEDPANIGKVGQSVTIRYRIYFYIGGIFPQNYMVKCSIHDHTNTASSSLLLMCILLNGGSLVESTATLTSSAAKELMTCAQVHSLILPPHPLHWSSRVRQSSETPPRGSGRREATEPTS